MTNYGSLLSAQETKIEALPIDPSVKDIIDKVLEQNKAILAQNEKIIEILSRPTLLVSG